MINQQAILILENPNLSNTVLASFLGISENQVRKFRARNGLSPNWKHDGKSIPFLRTVNAQDRFFFVVAHGNKEIHRGGLKKAIEQVDRLIYALDNGGSPPSFKQWVFKGLRYGNENIAS